MNLQDQFRKHCQLDTWVALQYSTSLQQLSSIGWSLVQLGFPTIAATDDTTTTFFTLAFKHAFSTFRVPVTAGSSSSTCTYSVMLTYDLPFYSYETKSLDVKLNNIYLSYKFIN